MFSQILSRIQTKSDADLLESEVSKLIGAIYERGSKYEEVIKSEVRSWVSQAVADEILQTTMPREKYLKDLKETLSGLSVIELTMAYEPTNDNIENIISWVRKNIGENLVLSMVYDPSLIGGAIISYKGKYINLSLVEKFNEVFPGVITHYGKV